MGIQRHRQLAHACLSGLERYPSAPEPSGQLPSRRWILDEAASVIATNASRPFALFAVGLVRFSEVTSAFGFDTGDAVRRQIGPRLEGACGIGARVARLDEGRFVMLIPGCVGQPRQFDRLARAAAKSLEEPFVVAGLPVAVEAALGVAVYPRDGVTPETLLGNAGVALSAAEKDNTAFAFYAPSQRTAAAGSSRLLARLRGVLDSGGLELHFQPLVDLMSERPVAVEALVRWPSSGLSPGDFIPLAERTGLIRRLDDRVLQMAIRQLAAWSEGGARPVLHVNLSAQTFQDEALPRRIAGLLESWAVPATQLGVEITETAMMTSPDAATRVCAELREMGVSIALDDFGAGYSPLRYLQQLAVSSVKIDRSFVANLADPDTATLVQTVIEMGHQLGLQIVAEGIEDAKTAQRLRVMRCDFGQGYYFGRPAAPDAMSMPLIEAA